MSRNQDHVVSVIVNSHRESRFLRFEQRFLARLGWPKWEVVRVADALSMSEGYNRAAAQARGDWFLFCHDDIEILALSARRVLNHVMARCDVFGVCGTRRLVSANWYDAGVPYTCGSIVEPDATRVGRFALARFSADRGELVTGIKSLDGVFIGMRREAFNALGGFDESYRDFHGYDVDISFRAALARLTCGVATGFLLRHNSDMRDFTDEKVEAWNAAQALFVQRHRRYLTPAIGVRGHEVTPLDCPEDAARVARQLRGRPLRLS